MNDAGIQGNSIWEEEEFGLNLLRWRKFAFSCDGLPSYLKAERD